MPINRRQQKLLADLVSALHTVREYLEPHTSWEDRTLQARAISAVRDAIGPSEERLQNWYDEYQTIADAGYQIQKPE